MEKEQIQEKVLRWQLLGEQWLKENQNIFIKKINGDIYFCKIILVGETKICVDVYAPIQRAGTKQFIDWLNIVEFDLVKGEGGNNAMSKM